MRYKGESPSPGRETEQENSMPAARPKITARTRLMDVLRNYPETRKVFGRHGMACRGCMGAAAETVASSAITHGLDPKEFVKELNRAVEEGSRPGRGRA